MRVSRAALFAVAMFTMALGSATVIAGCGGGSSTGKGAQAAANPCGGSAAANPCGGSAAANPCGNPCGANPCGGNPCGGNPCGGGGGIPVAKITQPAGTTLNTGGLNEADLLAKGEKLWNDKSLSGSGSLACATCHKNMMMFNPTFKAGYPHAVNMVKAKAGKDGVNAAEMVQFCMLAPMKSKVFAWDSVDLAALAAKVTQEQKAFAAK